MCAEFAPDCEITNRLVPTMHWWDCAINRACNKTQVMDVHNEPKCNASTVVAAVEPHFQFQWENLFFGQLMMQLVGMELESILTVKRKIHIRSILVGAKNEPPWVRTHSGLINWRNVDLVKRAMFVQPGAEHAPILDILLWHLWKLGCPSLLLFFGAWLQVGLESRLQDVDFLACRWGEDASTSPWRSLT